MYLKKMEIVGFKSFADRTKIEFDQGVTAVVGPNGSGKSNIVEALRWVLGEQSAKSLRGGKMPDVIFSGTAKRKPLNYTEVIVTFDNSDQYLTGHEDEKEVSITRRLYRNGDSEFLINGRKCRLKDIHELFTDTGLGRDSLSIISQGRIESVFNSKAEERRAIFEEAAGVLKYKTRRTETESKLKTTQDNLDRLEDIIFELNGQLTPLRAQRDVALRFQTLEAERSELALSVLIAQLLDEKEKYEKAKQDLEISESKLEELKLQQKDYEEEVVNLKRTRLKVENEQEKLQQNSLTLTELKADLQHKIEVFDLQKSSSEKTATERQARIDELGAKLLEARQKSEEVGNKKTQLIENEAKTQKQLLKLETELSRFSESPESLSERLREDYLKLVHHEAELSNNLTKNKAEHENISRRLTETNESARENSEKLQAITVELMNAEKALTESTQTMQLLEKELEEKTATEAQYAENERQGQNVMYDQMQQLSRYKADLASMENIRDSHSNLFQGVRAVMTQSQQLGGIVGVVADLLTFDKRYTTAIDIALGGGSQNIIVEDEKAAKAAISYLREKRLGRATFLPLTTIKPREIRDYGRLVNMEGFIDTALNLVKFEPRLQRAMSSLLSTTAIVDTAEHASQIARAMNYNIRIVTLDGTQINPGGSYSGGAAKRNSTTFTSTEIEHLTEIISIAESKLKKFEEKLYKQQGARRVLNEQMEILRSEIQERRLSEQALQLQIKQLSERQSDLQALVEIAEKPDAQQELQNLTKENEKISLELMQISEEKQALDAQLEEVKSNSESFNVLKNQKSNAFHETKMALSNLKNELRFVQADLDRLAEECSAIEAERGKLEAIASTQIDEKSRDQYANQLEETEIKLQESNVKLVSLRFERDDLQAQMEELEEQNRELLEQNQTLNNQKARLEVRIEQSEKLLRNRQNTLFTEYEMSFDQARSEAKVLENLSESEHQLSQLERQIRALGPINLDAISQFEEVNTRNTFLSGQRDDLLEAKEMLQGTIQEMNEEVEIRFKTTFEQIRESFQLTFSQMFAGGEANLELTSTNLLEAGVEIKVQPPGKKLASLNLMSGGEKALTALALIFAILRVRTVPFVVLDEVEAALDEANVKRFGDYMNHFDNSNQFIVVTHRRGTMAAAGTMYGVTMADAGVSKVISVRLDDKL
ncbi:chromosome segregation protein SMC [Lactococcus garvieae]|uniref:Chromosome partition protein Smc n=1 Tax=Lactococcus garvieae DCC43 TaxID=1231377 RepID=K2PMK4_9LACT|nr:chromosome segregation protein SMC [Lactococcus garvieae]EKF51484.1 Chromosome partition protein smc [Lactococcus garvieae DCC43]